MPESDARSVGRMTCPKPPRDGPRWTLHREHWDPVPGLMLHGVGAPLDPERPINAQWKSDDDVELHVLGRRLTYYGQTVTNA